MPGRRYSDGLHQVIEAKENVKVKRESKTLATTQVDNPTTFFWVVSEHVFLYANYFIINNGGL